MKSKFNSIAQYRTVKEKKSVWISIIKILFKIEIMCKKKYLCHIWNGDFWKLSPNPKFTPFQAVYLKESQVTDLSKNPNNWFKTINRVIGSGAGRLKFRRSTIISNFLKTEIEEAFLKRFIKVKSLSSNQNGLMFVPARSYGNPLQYQYRMSP